MKTEIKEIIDSEWTILKAVWDLEPVAAPTVQEALNSERGWAYTTVKTLMDRMVKKGLLTVQKIRNLYLYSAAITPTQARKKEIMKTVKRAFNGAVTPMMQFLLENETLTDKDYEQLEEILKKRKRG